jgi:hypothetical protein
MDNELNNINDTLLLEDERIVNYLKGRMTAEEEHAFIEELKTNPEFKSKAVAMARMVKGMKEVGKQIDEETTNSILASNQSEIEDIATDVSRGHRKGKVFSFRKAASWLSMAASVALIVWAGIGYKDYRQTTSLGEQYATTFSFDQLTRGAGEHSEAEVKLAKLFENIANKTDLDKTLHDLSLCWELSAQETYNDYTDFAPEIGWNLAIGYLKNNKRKQAKATLEKLIEVAPEGTAIGNKAREVLKKI